MMTSPCCTCVARSSSEGHGVRSAFAQGDCHRTPTARILRRLRLYSLNSASREVQLSDLHPSWPCSRTAAGTAVQPSPPPLLPLPRQPPPAVPTHRPSYVFLCRRGYGGAVSPAQLAGACLCSHSRCSDAACCTQHGASSALTAAASPHKHTSIR